MSRCQCEGTGFVFETGDYRTARTTLSNVQKVKRCPSYLGYFKQHPADGPFWADPDDWCPAAIQAHKAYVDKPKEPKRKGRWEKKE